MLMLLLMVSDSMNSYIIQSAMVLEASSSTKLIDSPWGLNARFLRDSMFPTDLEHNLRLYSSNYHHSGIDKQTKTSRIPSSIANSRGLNDVFYYLKGYSRNLPGYYPHTGVLLHD